MKRRLIITLKIVVPICVIAWLLASVDPTQWQELRAHKINWGLLAAAFVIQFSTVCLSFVRWYWLVRALGIPFSLGDAFRLGFVGYLCNFVSIGAVGGDLFKAFFIARERPARRTEAVATVVVDRIVGMYALMLVASTAILLGTVPSTSAGFVALQRLTLAATLVGGCGLAVAMVPAFTEGRLARALESLPRVGAACERLITSLRVYRGQRIRMLLLFLMSMSMHAMLAVAVYLIAYGIFGRCPPLIDQLVIVPMGMVAGSLPFTPAGLGSFEFAMDELFRLIDTSPQGGVSGVLIALVYRLITIVIAAVGVVYCWTCRVNVHEVLETAEAAA